MNLLSVEAAARKGVVEARRWDRTGEPPVNPEHRLQDIPFRPDPDFVGGRRLSLFIRLARVHAPKGGVTVQGKKFKGGEFIPGEVIDKATEEEKAKIEGNGDDAPKKANGKPKQTDTPQFRKWFGKSKVVDGNGQPLRVFHGATSSFEEFSFQDLGEGRENAAFFSVSPEVASGYARQQLTLADKKLQREINVAQETLEKFGDELFARDGNRLPERDRAITHGMNEMLGAGTIMREEYDRFFELEDKVFDLENDDRPSDELSPQVKATFLKLERPRVIDAKGLSWSDIVPQVLKSTDRKAHDGIIFKNVVDNPGGAEFASVTYAIFEPTNIKSATGNRGTFDPDKPDIRMATRLAQARAPKGGVSIGGKQFKGGEFIPGEVLEKATKKEKAAIQGPRDNRTNLDERLPTRIGAGTRTKGLSTAADGFIDSWVRISGKARSGEFPKAKERLNSWVAGGIDKVLDELQEHTQKQFQEANVEKIDNAMRGISLTAEHPLHKALASGRLKPGDEFALTGGDAGSWTEDFNTAGRSGGAGDSVIVERTIEASDVIASHRTQQGFFSHESEVLAKNPPKLRVRVKAAIINGTRVAEPDIRKSVA